MHATISSTNIEVEFSRSDQDHGQTIYYVAMFTFWTEIDKTVRFSTTNYIHNTLLKRFKSPL